MRTTLTIDDDVLDAAKGWPHGVLRIVGHPRYPNSPGSPVAMTRFTTKLCALMGHMFWPDDISLLDKTRVDASRLLTSARVTDSYLLALACAHGGIWRASTRV